MFAGELSAGGLILYGPDRKSSGGCFLTAGLSFSTPENYISVLHKFSFVSSSDLILKWYIQFKQLKLEPNIFVQMFFRS